MQSQAYETLERISQSFFCLLVQTVIMKLVYIDVLNTLQTKGTELKFQSKNKGAKF